MVWLIVLLVVGLVAIVGYRYYYNPPLSRTARQQKRNYVQKFRYGKKLFYRMNSMELLGKLKTNFIDAGCGCFYGNGGMLHLKTTKQQVIIYLFSDTPENLTRLTWRLVQLKNQTGGMRNSSPNE